MAEYVREQRKQVSRGIANSGAASRQLKGVTDGKSYFEKQAKNVSQFWTKPGVDYVVITANEERNPEGVDAIKELNRQDYTVRKVKETKIERRFLESPEKVVTLIKRGGHNRSNKLISIWNSLDDKDASSTLVHEVTHAKQHEANEATSSGKKPYPDTLSKEIEAHEKQEEYNIKIGNPPKKGITRKDGNKIDRDSIRSYVERVYSVGSGAAPHEDTITGGEVEEEIKPWVLELPKHLEGEGIEETDFAAFGD